MQVFLSFHYKGRRRFLERVPRAILPHADVRARIVSVLLILPHRQSCSADAASRAPLGTWYEQPRVLKAHNEFAWEKSRYAERRSEPRESNGKGTDGCAHLPVAVTSYLTEIPIPQAPPYSWIAYGRSGLETRRYARGVPSAAGIRGQSDIYIYIHD